MSKGYALIVDDDPEFAELLASNVRLLGYEVETASGGKEAFEFLQRQIITDQPVPALVISDWKMANGDGITLLANLRKFGFRSLPFLLMSGQVTEIEIRNAIHRDADGVLLKPFSHQELRAEIDETVRRREIKLARAA
jgi:CheY-like chemotaxis protein